MNFFDLHCDTAYELYKNNLDFDNKVLCVTKNDSKYFNNWVQTFAIWISDNIERPFELYKNIITDINKKLRSIPKNLTPVFSVEGGALIENDIERLSILKKDRIKMLSLTWNGENPIAGGSKTEKPLTEFGRTVIKELNNQTIATDLSHLNKQSFFPAIEISDYPIVSHSNCYEIYPHPRNITFEQIKLIAEKNGIIGLTFYPEFLGDNVFQKLYENIYLLCDNGLENNIGIGTDFDGGKMNKSLNRISKITELYIFLKNKGLNNFLLDKIFYENAYNFIAKL